MAETRSGIPLQPVYGQAEMEAASGREPGPPGRPPYTRGITPRMYLEKPWIMGQYAGFGSAEQTNARFQELLKAGQTGFSVALDLPTQLGLDSDHPHALGEVGRVGVAIDSLADMEVLFDGIPLQGIRQIRTTANSIGHLWLALNVALAEKKGHDPNAVKILIQNDVLKEYIARGTQIYPARAGLRIVADVIAHCARNLPSWTPLSMSGYHMREAGANAVQELAFTFANGIAYCEAAVERGLSVDEFAPSLFTFLTADMELLEEVAKFRAARNVWDWIMSDRFGAENPESRALRIFAFSAGSNLTAQQPMVNVVRVSLNALAAVLGGVQTLHTSAYDEALGVPTEEAATLALRTQQVILEESGITKVVDPLGGSYVIEALTAEIERRVRVELDKIEELGGALRCIESGWFKEQIADSAYRIQTEIDSGVRKVVGVNCYVVEDGQKGPDPFQIDEAIEKEQVQRLREVRARRDGRAVRESLSVLERAAREGTSIVPPTIAAVRAYATVGEISETLRDVFGSFEPDAVI
ncbi:MAG TPA: methylmalonyl-CoA mutase family protein [Candidatus Dormibacteraeota bacterium]